MAVKKTEKPVNPLDQENVETTDDLLQKAAIHRMDAEETTTAHIAKSLKPKASDIVPAYGRNPYADDPAYDDLIEIHLPVARAGESANASISLNGVSWMIPRGKPVLVPRPVYDQFMRVQEAEQAEIRMHNQMISGMDSAHFGMGYRVGEQPV